MLKAHEAVLLVIDVQGKLARLMHESEQLIHNIQLTIQAAHILNIPILWAEQVPDKLGPTVAELAALLAPLQPMAKSSFSCVGNDEIKQKIIESGKKRIIVCGIEAHVCVFQTVRDLLSTSYCVYVLTDAVGSRTLENKQIGIRRMEKLGAVISSVEMTLFELLEKAEGEQFKAITKLLK